MRICETPTLPCHSAPQFRSPGADRQLFRQNATKYALSGAARTTADARTRRSAGGDLPGSNAPQLSPSRRDSRKPNCGRWLMLRHRLNPPTTGGAARCHCMLGWMCLPLARCQKADTGPGHCQCFSTCGAGTTSGLPFFFDVRRQFGTVRGAGVVSFVRNPRRNEQHLTGL